MQEVENFNHKQQPYCYVKYVWDAKRNINTQNTWSSVNQL